MKRIFSFTAVFGALTALSITAQAQSTPVLNPANGHYYQAVTDNRTIDWFSAKKLCETTPFLGLQGYLATLTSRSENDFAARLVAKSGVHSWIGGYKDIFALVPAIRWVTGEPFDFDNFAPGEPNNAGGNEIVLAMNSANGQWNDVRLDGRLNVNGFVAEWGPSEVTVQSLSVSPAIVEGGKKVTLTVTLKEASPKGGALLTLNSSLSQGTSNLPPTVSIRAGAKSATVSFVTDRVSSTQSGQISVFGANKVSKPLTVNVVEPIQSVTLSPTTIHLGGTANGTITLKTAATADLTVQISANRPDDLFLFPGSSSGINVVIKAGQRSGKFQAIDQNNSGRGYTATITVTLGTQTIKRTLTVVP